MNTSQGTTRERLLEAAEALFAERGYDAVSVRDVARRARANLAAAGYHFGSKEQLFVEALAGRARPLNARRLAALEALEAGGTVPPLRAVLDAFSRTMIEEALADPERGTRLHRLVSRAFAESDVIGRRVFREEMLPLAMRFHAAIRRTCPWLSPEEAGYGLALFAGCIVHALRWAVQPPLPVPRPVAASLDELMRGLLNFGEAGFQAIAGPAIAQPPSRRATR